MFERVRAPDFSLQFVVARVDVIEHALQKLRAFALLARTAQSLVLQLKTNEFLSAKQRH